MVLWSDVESSEVSVALDGNLWLLSVDFSRLKCHVIDVYVNQILSNCLHPLIISGHAPGYIIYAITVV